MFDKKIKFLTQAGGKTVFIGIVPPTGCLWIMLYPVDGKLCTIRLKILYKFQCGLNLRWNFISVKYTMVLRKEVSALYI